MILKIKNILKYILEKIPITFVERLLTISIIKNKFYRLRNTETYTSREELWSTYLPSDEKITFIEFGVHKGDSLKKFTHINSHPESLFYGFDSFLGLPENWTPNHPIGTFDLKGKMPSIKDSRVSIIDGYFQIYS